MVVYLDFLRGLGVYCELKDCLTPNHLRGPCDSVCLTIRILKSGSAATRYRVKD